MDEILIGKGERPVHLLPRYGNRHGLVAGATGTGKTISLMVMAEGFSRLGVPVFIADVKGDVAGLAMAGTPNEKIRQPVAEIGIQGYTNEASPVVFWDLYGKAGHPVRATVSEVGPSLLGRMLEIAFKLADDRGLLLLLFSQAASEIVASTNRRSYDNDAFAGRSWLVSPEGEILLRDER